VPEGLGLPTLRHEAVHAILDREVRGTNHEWPTWLNEGLAQAFEAGRLDASGRLVPGPLDEGQAWHVRRLLRDGTLEETWRLVSRSHEEFMADATTSYAHAAALVLYLMERRWDEFLEHFEDERKPGRLDPGVFTTRFGADLRGEMEAWIAGQ
jgi:hypothetical protein